MNICFNIFIFIIILTLLTLPILLTIRHSSLKNALIILSLTFFTTRTSAPSDQTERFSKFRRRFRMFQVREYVQSFEVLHFGEEHRVFSHFGSRKIRLVFFCEQRVAVLQVGSPGTMRQLKNSDQQRSAKRAVLVFRARQTIA